MECGDGYSGLLVDLRSGFKPGQRNDGFGSFGSFGSIKSSPTNSKNSHISGFVMKDTKFVASDFDSNGSVELLMMKSAKSANVNMSKSIKGEINKYSGMIKLAKKNNKSKQSKARGKIIKSYFREAESLGHIDSGSNKINNLISYDAQS